MTKIDLGHGAFLETENWKLYQLPRLRDDLSDYLEDLRKNTTVKDPEATLILAAKKAVANVHEARLQKHAEDLEGKADEPK